MKLVILFSLLAVGPLAWAADPAQHTEVFGLAPAASLPARMKVVDWNVEKAKEKNFAAEYRRITAGAHLVALKEATTRINLFGLAQMASSARPLQFFFAGPLRYPEGFSGTATGGVVAPARAAALFSRDLEPGIGTGKVVAFYPVAGRTLLVANTHGMNAAGKGPLAGDPFERQITDVKARLASHRGPLLWVGDFNTANKRKLKILLTATSELGLTEVEFPEKDERLLKRGLIGRQALDRAFVRGLDVRSASCIKTDGSDHNAVVLELRVP
ncbi:MAG TPA: hypothetical protein VGO11_09600 [Chthoniobacteraceae bacterium]|jgi:endonuclease/exonuclease/phosphatase family metal-dependent hydrolase|nr:hypothetical protein [Chthoniobacteraceae bacterium]